MEIKLVFKKLHYFIDELENILVNWIRHEN